MKTQRLILAFFFLFLPLCPFCVQGQTVVFGYNESGQRLSLYLTDRGYTMHEHIPGTDLIDMNGRMYGCTTATIRNARMFPPYGTYSKGK